MLDCGVCVHLSLHPINAAVTVVNGQAVCLVHMPYIRKGDFGTLIQDVLDDMRRSHASK